METGLDRRVVNLDNPKIPKRYGKDMPVIDVMLVPKGRVQRRFVSIADGSLEYSIRKFERLAGISQQKKFAQMLKVMKRYRVNGRQAFLKGAELHVPAQHVEPLRLLIASRYSSSGYRALRRRSGFDLDRLLEMVQPLPIKYVPR